MGHSCAKRLVQQWLCYWRPRAGRPQPQGFSESKTAYIASTREKALTTSVSEVSREIALREVVGLTRGLLAAKQQLISEALNSLPLVGGIGSGRPCSRRNVED